MTSRVDVPAALVASHARFFGEAGRAWIAGLPALAARFLQRWRLQPCGPVLHGAVALVIPVTRADGAPAALKLQPIEDQTRREPDALRLWNGQAAVRLLDSDEATGSMLLERLDPARTLGGLPHDLDALRIICESLNCLNSVPAPADMPRLADIAEAMLDRAPHAIPLLTDGSERRLLADCASAIEDVAADASQHLLHWDLHYANVLAPQHPTLGRAWVAIDPKPLSGDPCFELLPALWNRWADVVAVGNTAAAVRRRFDLMTDLMELDRQRAVRWTLGRVLQNALWDLERFHRTVLHSVHKTIAEVLRVLT